MTKVYVVTSFMSNYPEDDQPWVDGVFSTEDAAKEFAASVQHSTYIRPTELDPPVSDPPRYHASKCWFDIGTGKVVDEMPTYFSNEKIPEPHAAVVKGYGASATIISRVSIEHCKRIAEVYYDDLIRGTKHPTATYYYD